MKTRLVAVPLFVVALFPFAFVLVLSVSQQWVFPRVLPAAWSLAPWRTALGSGDDLGGALLTSLLVALTVGATGTLLGFASARTLARMPRGGRWLRVAYLPYVFAPVILAACLQVYFLRFGLSGSVAGVLLAHLLIVYPYAVILAYSFWTPRLLDTEDLARTLGATPTQVRRRVTWHLLRGPLNIVFFQCFLISWFEYGLTLLIGVGKVETLPLKVFQFVNEANIFYAAMAASLLILPPVLLLWINKRLLFVTR